MRLAITLPALVLVAVACRHPGHVRQQPLTAAEIQQKIVGTWFLDQWFDGAPSTITVTFGADGSFESSRGPQKHHAMWHATDGYFTVTKSNALPSSNLQMFVVDRLDDHEMICGHPSVAGRDKFRR